MEEEKGLIPVEKLNSAILFREGIGIDELIEYVRVKAYEVPRDVSTPKGRDAIRSQAYEISRCKAPVDKAKKKQTEDLKRETKAIDANGKKLIDAIALIQSEYRQPLTEWEAEEAAREAAEKLAIEIELCHVEALKENEVVNQLRELAQMKAAQAKQEADRLEKERLDREAAAQKEREERIAKEAAERAEREAAQRIKDAEDRERKQKAAAEAAEQARIAAEAKAKRDAEEAAKQAEANRLKAIAEAEARVKAENDRKGLERIAKEKAEKEAEARKAANKKHQAKVQLEAVTDFISAGYNQDTALHIVDLINNGRIKNISINY